MTYLEILQEFRCKVRADIIDFRPCCELYDVPNIPNAIVVWLKDGGKIIYIHEE